MEAINILSHVKQKKNLIIPINTNREYVMVAECVNVEGFTIAPFTIIAAKCMLRGWFDALDKNQNVSIGVLDTGYINDKLAFQWIQHVNCETHRKTKGRY